jgi:cytochrome c oxidase subunit 2
MKVAPQRLSVPAAAALAAAILLSACGSSKTATTGSSPHSRGGSSSLVAAGKSLYATDGCEDCHTLDGTPATGPSWKGLYLSRVHLTSGKTVIATAAYLTKHIVDPDAMTVSGYPGSVMAEAIQADNLGSDPGHVRALVAFIESLR